MSGTTRGPFFQLALLGSLLTLTYLCLPFVGVVLAALVLVVVTWPIFELLSDRVGPHGATAILTTTTVAMIVLPLGFAGVLAFRELMEASTTLLAFLDADGLETWLAQVRATLPPTLAGWLARVEIMGLIERALQGIVQRSGGLLTDTVQAIGQGSLQVLIFVVCLASLYSEGPTLAATLRRATPMPRAVVDRLFEVFRQLCYSVLVGMAATSMGQGAMAALGFYLVGMSRVALIGLATAITCQVPVIGSAVVWVPLVISLLLQQRFAAAVFAAAWSMILTASVDNVLKPLIYRQALRVHAALMLLALLGGLLTLGPPGLLVGPFVLILFVTLFTLYDPGSPDSARS